MTLQVLTHIAGSNVVVMRNPERFIDARCDIRYPGFSFLECVYSGQVRRYESVPDYRAPERIVELMKSWL